MRIIAGRDSINARNYPMSVPRPSLRRRYADAPAAAQLTGLGAGEWLAPRGHTPFIFLTAASIE
jgi:hypothetical protein